jgi:hypothetical protein
MVPQGLIVLFPVVLGGDFRSPLLVFFLGVFGPCSWGFDGGKLVGTLHGFLGYDSLPNP